MRTLRVVAQLWLVALSAAALLIAGLVFGASRPGVTAEIATDALASPEARAEIAASITDEVRAGSPFGAVLPGVDLLILEAVESRVFDDQIAALVERSVRARLGLPVDATKLHLSDLLDVSNPLIQAGIHTVPPVELAPASGSVGGFLAHGWLGTVVLFGGAVIGFVAVRVLAGRARAAAVAGFGAMVGAVALLAVPWVAAGHGALEQIVAESVVDLRFVFAGACVSAVVMARGLLAGAGIVLYRNHLDSPHFEVAPPDLAWEF